MRITGPSGQAVRKATRYAACGRDEGSPPTASAGGRAVCCPAYACLRSRCARLCNLSPCRRARPLRRPCPAPLPGLRRVRQLQAGLPVACQARPPSIRHRPRIAAVPRRWLATAQASPGAGAGRETPPAGGNATPAILHARPRQAACGGPCVAIACVARTRTRVRGPCGRTPSAPHITERSNL